MRLFVGLELPAVVRERLALLGGGIPGARWVPRENFHLTLRFLGELPAHRAEDVDHALSGVTAASFTLTLAGVGTFARGGREASLWMGVERNPALEHLHDKVEVAVKRAGLEADKRKFSAHVTLARLDGNSVAKLGEFVQSYNLSRIGPIEVGHFTLFSSRLGKEASVYTPEVTYPLRAPRAVAVA